MSSKLSRVLSLSFHSLSKLESLLDLKPQLPQSTSLAWRRVVLRPMQPPASGTPNARHLSWLTHYRITKFRLRIADGGWRIEVGLRCSKSQSAIRHL